MDSGNLTARTFEQLFNDKYEQLYYFAYDYVSDGETAKDIVSEAFAALWKGRDRITEKKLNSYLHISVRNRCLDHLRTGQHQMVSAEDYQESLLQDEDWEVQEQRIRQLQEEIRLLPPRTQWMLKEKYYNGHSYKELSELLGISPDGIKKLVSRTYSTLRDRLNAKKG